MADLFNLAEARAQRDIGLKLVQENNSVWIYECRQIAERIAKSLGRVTSDDIQHVSPRPDHVHPNSVGAIFNDKRFELIGYQKSSRVSGHARRIGIWKLKDQTESA